MARCCISKISASHKNPDPKKRTKKPQLLLKKKLLMTKRILLSKPHPRPRNLRPPLTFPRTFVLLLTLSGAQVLLSSFVPTLQMRPLSLSTNSLSKEKMHLLKVIPDGAEGRRIPDQRVRRSPRERKKRRKERKRHSMIVQIRDEGKAGIVEGGGGKIVGEAVAGEADEEGDVMLIQAVGG